MLEDKPRVVITDADDLDYTIALELLAAAGIEAAYLDTRDRQVILDAGRHCDGIIVGYAALDADMIDRMPKLRAIATMSAGFDMVDVAAAAARDIPVCTVPSVATKDVATHAFAGLLSLIRELPRSHAATLRGDWTGEGLPVPPRVSELTLGIVGFGRIAQYLAEIARPVFGSVIACDPFVAPENWPDWVRRGDLPDVLAAANVLSLHTPLTDQTRHILDAEALALLPAGAYVANVARGALIDEDALLDALATGRVAGAMLDVLEQEPAPADHPLVSHPRVIVTPHAAYRSNVSLREYVALPARNIIACLQGREPETPLRQALAAAK
ncbi:C-terminal binding protein [Specibacter cremeus]|uniref:C-terminal binding protein n=1 Tax=Specibacter cremeus TaxID=1629051 RepID=UPI000F7B67BE|nr:C-terminal binding protein [Specibacter cremeus]